jgi:hypothetical protein
MLGFHKGASAVSELSNSTTTPVAAIPLRGAEPGWWAGSEGVRRGSRERAGCCRIGFHGCFIRDRTIDTIQYPFFMAPRISTNGTEPNCARVSQTVGHAYDILRSATDTRRLDSDDRNAYLRYRIRNAILVE